MATLNENLITTTDFGESQFGPRLNYSKPKYRDPIFAILYYLHLIGIIGAAIYIWAISWPDIKNNSDESSSFDFKLTGIFVGVIACALIGVLFGLFWLQIMKKFAGTIIKAMLFFNIGVWVVVAIAGIFVNLALVVIGVIMVLIYSIWTWCIWRRIPFASALLGISAQIISKYSGTICLSLSVIVLNILWVCIWISCFAGYITISNKTTDNGDGTTTQTSTPSEFVIFLFLISLYWGFQVNKNVSHTTTCGVAATWYFTMNIDHKPTPAAFKRTMTTSFGSVCLGSLIVAFLQAVRAMLRNSRGRGGILKLIALCLLGCIERLIRYFNKYAYAQCAIYGSSFIQSAKATWNLFMSRGILAIINDDLTSMAIICGSIIGGVVAGGCGAFIGYEFYQNDDDHDARVYIPIALGVYGFLIGLVLCHCVLMVLHSAVITLFVCYAEDPAAMSVNRPQEYNRLVEAKPTFAVVNQQYGNGGPRSGQQNEYGPAVVVQPAQPVVYAQQQQQQVVYVQPQQQVVYAQPPQQQQQQQQRNYNDGNMYNSRQ